MIIGGTWWLHHYESDQRQVIHRANFVCGHTYFISTIFNIAINLGHLFKMEDIFDDHHTTLVQFIWRIEALQKMGSTQVQRE